MLLAALLCSAHHTACLEIEPPAERTQESIKNRCPDDRRCPVGFCDEETQRCVRRTTQFQQLKLELIPPASDTLFGGFKFFQELDLSKDEELVVRQPPRVAGNAYQYQWLPAETCSLRDIRVRFRSRRGGFGGDVLTYTGVGLRGFDFDERRFVNQFTLPGLPPDVYDVYWGERNPATAGDCPIVPQIVRGVSIGTQAGVQSRLRFEQGGTANAPLRVVMLNVKVSWRSALDGWRVDVVHGITGEVLSPEATLSEDAVEVDALGAQAVRVQLPRSIDFGEGQDYALPGQPEVLRLRPPPGVDRHTLLRALVFADSESRFERGDDVDINLKPFLNPVQYRARLLGETEPNVPIPGRVTFIATRLIDVPDGMLADFTRTVQASNEGIIESQLLPGDYDVHVFPKPGSGAAGFTTRIRVWAPPADANVGEVQAGQILFAPNAVKLTGRIHVPGGEPPIGVRVRAESALRGGFRSVLERRLPFRPRAVSTLVDNDGRFELSVDCGTCTEDEPLLFNVVAVPPDDSSLPWTVWKDLPVSYDVDLGELELTLPRVYRGEASFQRTGIAPAPFPGVRIRALAMLDREGNVASDLPACFDLPPMDTTTPCVQRLIQVAEARSNATGAFELLIPNAFGALTPE